MNLKAFRIKNFRRLRDVHIQLDSPTSIFVGANNSGKTSATHIFQMFLAESGEKFAIHDFSASCWNEFNSIDISDFGSSSAVPPLPVIALDLWFEVNEGDLHRIIDLLPSLEWKDALVGVRIEYAARDPKKVVENFCEALREGQQKRGSTKDEDSDYQPWPKSFTDYLSKRLGSEYEKKYYVLDVARFGNKLIQEGTYVPLPLGTNERSGAAILKTLLKVDFLSAQRHISDTNSPSRSEDLSKRLSKFYERNLEQQSEEENFEALRALASSEEQLNSHLAKVFTPTLARLNDLGYPGFFDPHLVIKSALNPESVLKQNAQVHYALGNPGQLTEEVVLPDKYNGLGFKMLIYMVIEVLDFHARWAATKNDRPPLHLVIIEEPEAHLHAQLQQVFIRKILEIIPEEAGNSFSTQLIVTTHSPHIIYESGFMPIRYFRRSKGPDLGQFSEVLNLSAFQGITTPETSRFLQQYMKLTHCDLFFADALILVEGNVERLLLPLMISKSARDLRLSYLSILEVGGAFAHLFKDLIHFLGLTTLVITDLDSVKEPPAAVSDRKPAVEDEEFEKGRAESCQSDTPEAITSNQCLRNWLPKLTKVSELLNARAAAKIHYPTTDEPALIRVCYQTVQDISWNSEKGKSAGRTLEEAFALENLEWCQNLEQKDLHLKVCRKDRSDSLADMLNKTFKRVNSSGFKKTEFALGLMTKMPDEWQVPTYIKEGLLWLVNQLKLTNQRNVGTDIGANISAPKA